MISELVKNSNIDYEVVNSFLFLHKTTWREYFGVWVSWDAMRWLCAPFFSLVHMLLLNPEIPKQCKEAFFKPLCSCYVGYFWSYICIRQHDVNILMLWVSWGTRDDCVLRFFLVIPLSSLQTPILKSTNNKPLFFFVWCLLRIIIA